MSASAILVRIEDVRAAGLCVSGARQWFASNGLDFREFLKEGLPAPVLAALGDSLADRAIAAAELRHG